MAVSELNENTQD